MRYSGIRDRAFDALVRSGQGDVAWRASRRFQVELVRLERRRLRELEAWRQLNRLTRGPAPDYGPQNRLVDLLGLWRLSGLRNDALHPRLRRAMGLARNGVPRGLGGRP